MTSKIDFDALPIGRQIGIYSITGLLGQGGFGITYKGHEERLNRFVAIKEYLPQDLALRRPDFSVAPRSVAAEANYHWGLESFLKEAQTLARFQQANIVPVLDYFEANGTAYLVMPFLEGRTLESQLAAMADGRLDEEALLKWLRPLLAGLETIHSQGFLHRDIKPENIYLLREDHPQLIDFGAARNAVGGRSRSLSVVLTPGYAPIEQYGSTAANQGPWTDLYALGAVMFRCLSGRAPIDSTERQDCAVNNEPDPLLAGLDELSARLSPPLFQALEACLRLARRDRVQSVAELRRILSGEPVVDQSQKATVFRPLPDGHPANDKADESGASVVPAGSPPSPSPASGRRPTRLIVVAALVIIGLGALLAAIGSQKGDPQALLEQGTAYLDQGLYRQGASLVRQAAEQGLADAQALMGIIHSDDRTSEQNHQEALRWFRLAAEQGHAGSMGAIGYFSYMGWGTEADEAAAAEWCAAGAEDNSGLALMCLAEMNLHGTAAIPKNEALALEYYRRAAEADEVLSMNALGVFLADGFQGLEMDRQAANEWFQKAADRGLALGNFNLGHSYENGLAVEPDQERAFEYFNAAADPETRSYIWYQADPLQGRRLAQAKLGEYYFYGQGVPRNHEAAAYWFEQAAGNGDLEALFRLAVMLENGQGRPADVDRAIELYQQAASNGHSGAQNNLGMMHYHGRGFTKDADAAAFWLKKAVDQGNITAMANLAYFYLNGLGVKPDAEEAFRLYRQSAEAGHAESQYFLGRLYADGRGTPADAAQALNWTRQAARQGWTDAQYELGEIYRLGQGLDPDATQAAYWHGQAAGQGHEKSGQVLREMGLISEAEDQE